MDAKHLIEQAIEAMMFSYAPYSHFHVGAAALGKSGRIYKGCNIENAAYSPTNCAERTAIFKGVSEGEREFVAIALVGGKQGIMEDFISPCGVCRQVMMEFCNTENFKIIMAKSIEEYKEMTLEELLPMGFGPEHF